MGEPRTVRFRSGRHRDFWVGSVVGVGNAYGFVEPLESTALHMIITRAQLRYGETVLVNAAGSGVGVAAIQVAKLHGAIHLRAA